MQMHIHIFESLQPEGSYVGDLLYCRKNSHVPRSQGASLGAQLVKNLPAVQETWVQSLGWEDPLVKGKASYSSILAWRNPWTV